MPARRAGLTIAYMTASSSTQIYSQPLTGRGLAMAAAVGAAGLLALVTVSVASLAVAFPIVLSLADRGRITLSAADLATSRQLADMAWAFVAVGALHLLAAMAAIGDRPRGAGRPAAEPIRKASDAVPTAPRRSLRGPPRAGFTTR